MSDIYQKGTKVGGGRKPKQYADDRICVKEECTVKLSKYNKKKFCFNHAPITYGRIRGATQIHDTLDERE